MDYEQFFSTQTMPECVHEKFTIGMLTFMIAAYILVDCVAMCNASRKMKSVQDENETLKSIVLKSVERNLLRMMHQPEEEED
jgi:hypothetical protein